MSTAIKISDYILIPTDLPLGQFKYSSLKFAYKNLPKSVYPLIDLMCQGLEDPRITYRHSFLKAGEGFGHCKFHTDGLGCKDEIHRLITQEGLPTLGYDGAVLTANYIWQFDGEYTHRAQPTDKDTYRIMIRVSQSNIDKRNYWTK